MSEVKGPNIFQKINKVTSELEALVKDGKNPMGYKYLSHAQVLSAIRPLLVKHGVVVYPVMAPPQLTDVIDKKTGNVSGKMTTFQSQFKFVNIDNPEDYFIAATIGQGVDTGDKGAYKAATGAMKYMLFQTFLVETDDDPENEKVKPGLSASKSSGSDF